MYEKVRHLVDADALHDLIARVGPAILDREFPYIVVAARNELRGRLRRSAREVPLEEGDDYVEDHEANPEEAVIRRLSYRALLDALAELDDSEVLLLWRQAEGVSDEEVIAEWEARGFAKPGLTRATLRKRRERARRRLRAVASP